MPSYEYTDPQGKSFTLEVDEELNPDQVYQKFADAGIAPRVQQPNQESPGYLSQLGGALSTGYGQMTSGVGATFNALTGDVPDVAVNLAEMARLQREQQAAQTPEDLALAQEFARTEEEYERARGPLESMSALSGYLGATMRHPGAAVKQAVQSAPNALISGATGLAGYALGGLAGGAAGIETGPGAILTGIAGATAGGAISNSLMEAGPAIYDILNEKTGGAAASMTADQIAEYLKKNPDIMSEGLKTGAIRGTVIGAIEGLGLKGAGRLATIPERAAARAAQKTLVDAGVDIASKEAVEAALKRPALRSAVEAASKAAKEQFTSAGNLARMGGAAGIEIGASGAGELGAQLAAGQEVSPTEIYQEMLGEGVLSLPVAATSKALEARKYLMPEAQAGEIPSTPEQEFEAPADTVPTPVSPEEETMRNPALEIAKEVGEASTASLAAIGSEQSAAAMAEFNATLDEIEAQAAQPPVQPSEAQQAPSPATEMTEKSSQTITGSNVQTGTEMPVPGESTVTSPGEAPLVTPEEESLAAQRRADLLSAAADAAKGKTKAQVSPVVTAMVTPQQPTPQGKPTPATEGKVTPGGVATERDLTKPEELSSEESAALRVSKLKGAKHQGDGVIFVPEKLMTPERRKAVQRGGKSIEVKAWADVTGVTSDRGYAILDRRARRAFRENKPVLSEAVDTYGIKLPEGYVKQGDLYVFQPSLEQSGLGAGVATERVADKVYLSVPFTSKDAAKSLGAKWDKEKKLWFIQRGENGFMPEVSPRWIPDEQAVLRDKKELSAAKLNAEAKYNRSVEIAETNISGRKAFALKFTDGQWLNPNVEKTEQSFQQEQPQVENIWMLPVEETEQKIWQNVFSRENEKLSDMKKGRRNPRSPYFNIRDSELDKQQREINRLQNNKNSIGIEWGELIRYFDQALADKKPISADQEKLFVAKRLPREEFLARLARAGYEKHGDVFYHKQSSAGGGAVGQTRTNLPPAAGGTPQPTAAETQTPESLRVDSGAAGVVQSETGKGSILPAVETKETPYKEESSGKVEAENAVVAPTFNEKAALYNDLLQSDAEYRSAEAAASEANRIFLEERAKVDVRKRLPFNYSYKGPKVHQERLMNLAQKAAQARQIANAIAKENGNLRRAYQALENKESEPVPEKVVNPEIEAEEEIQRQNAQSLARIFNDKLRTNPVKGLVSSGDVERAIGQLQNSGEVPGAIFTWRGTAKELQRLVKSPAFRKAFPGVAQNANNKNAEGWFENGMAFIITDQVDVSDLDRARAAAEGTTPEVAAAKRVIAHENYHKGVALLSPKDQAQLVSLLRKLFPAAELDDLAKSYKQYADWRTNRASEYALLEEKMQKAIEEMDEVPRDGLLRELVDFLKAIWRRWTGQPKGEPKLRDLKDVVRLLRSTLKDAHKAQANRTANGGRVMMSLPAFRNFVPAVNLNGRIETGASHYEAWLKHAIRQIPSHKKDGLSDSEVKDLADKWLVDHPEAMANSMTKEGFVTDEGYLNRQDSLKKFLALGGKQRLDPGEVRDWLDSADVESARMSLGTNMIDAEYLEAVANGDMEKAQWLAYESYQASQSEMTAKNYLAIIGMKREYENLVGNLEQAYDRALKGDDAKEQDVGSYFGPQLVGKDELHQSLRAIAKTPEEIVELLWRQYASGVRPMPTTRDYLAYMQNVGIIPSKMDNAWDFINSDEADNIKNRVAVEAQKWLNLSREGKVPTINPKTDPVYQRIINDWLVRNPKSAQTLRDLVGSKGELIKLDAKGMPMAGFGRFDHKGVLAVAYDDAGNVIPLSQRFQPASPDIRFSLSPVQYSSENDEIQSSAQQTSRSMDYTPRQLEVHFAVRKAYDAMPKDNGVAVPLFELFDKTKEFVPDLNAQEFSQIVQGLYDDNAALLNTAKKMLHHGTPHKVDRFRLDKIGTGEGAQAYGWGLYFAENLGVARDYQRKLAPVGTKKDPWYAKEVRDRMARGEDWQTAFKAVYQQSGADNATRRKTMDGWTGPSDVAEPVGNLYTVELLGDPDAFLDWDKPLSEQSEKVKAALDEDFDESISGQGIYRSYISKFYPENEEDVAALERKHGRLFMGGDMIPEVARAASEYLASLGIPGIKYLDGGSRGKGEGNRNFVVFDENSVRIVKENEQPVFPILNRDNEPASSVVILPGKGMASLGTALSPEEYARHAELESKNKAGTITPEETKEAEKLVEKAARRAGYNVGPVWHLSQEDFNEFSPEFRSQFGTVGPGFYFSGKPSKYLAKKRPVQRKFFLKISKPLPLDKEGMPKRTFMEMLGRTMDAAVEKKMEGGVSDGIINSRMMEGTYDGIYTVWNSEQIKSADPFTGVPLEQRFDVTSPDIRFSYGAADSSAAATYRNEVDVISKGLPVGREYQGAPMKGMSVEDHATFNQNAMGDAAERLLKSLSKDHSMEEIFELLQQPEFQRELGLFDPTMVKSDAAKLTYLKLVAQFKQRAWHASNKAKTEGQRIKANVLYRQVSQYYANLTTGGGQFLQSIQQIHEDPRSRFAFDIERAENEMAKANAEAVENQSGPEGMNPVKANIENMVNGSGESATEDVLEEVEEDQDAIDLAEGEATLEDPEKSLYEEYKNLLREEGILARLDREEMDTGAKMSISPERRSELAGLTKEERAKLREKNRKRRMEILSKLLGREEEAKTPEQKKTRKKREKMVQTVEKRAKSGKSIDPAVKEAAEIEMAEKTASQIVYRFEELYRQGFKNPPQGMTKKEQKDSIIKAFRDQVKNPTSFEDFAARLADLKVGEEVAERLFLTASRERADLIRVKDFRIKKRKVEIADKQASRLIYATEERFRQGSKDLNKSKDGDSINKAFRDQVENPVSESDFLKRLDKLNVTQDVASRLFKTAAREKADQEAMAAYDMLQGPDALKKMLREIQDMRRGEEIPFRTPIPWRELLSQRAKTVDEYRKRIFDAVSANKDLQNLSDEQKNRLAKLFADAWEAKREAILKQMLDKYSANLEQQKETRKLAKALKDSRNQLLELVNLGAYNNDELVRAIGERFGLKSEFTAEEKAKLNDLADRLQDDTLNRAKRNKLAREYLSLLESATGIPASELMSMIWVTSVLNGGGTIFSIATSFLNGFYVIMGNHAARAWTELARGNYKEAVDIMLDTFKAMSKWLQSYAPSAERAWNYLWTGDVSLLEAAANDPFQHVKTLGDIQRHQANAERLAKDPKLVKQYIGRYLRFWGRLLTALDAFNVMTNKAGAMALAMRQSGLTSEQIKEIDAAHDMAVFKKRIIETDPFFKGQKPTDSFGRSYLTSLAEAAMYESLAKMGVQVENADFMASESAYTMNPTGVGGIFYNFVKGVDTKATNFTKDFMKRAEGHWAKKKNWDTGWEMFLAHLAQFLSYQVVNAFGLRFARFAGNKFNQGLSFIPGVGLLRRRELSNEHLKGREQAFIDSIKRNQIAGLLMGVIGFSLLKAIVDEPDDEKRGWGINGGFNNLNPDQKRQKLARGEKEYTIRIGNLVWNYQNSPIAQPLAAIGAMADMIRFSPDKWKGKNVGDKLMSSALSGLKATLEIPALTQVGELLGTGVSSKDPTEQTQNRLVRALAGWSGGFMPRFLKDIDYMAEPTMRKYETFWQKTSSHIPVYRRYTGKDFYDILGNPVEKNAILGSREFAKLDERPEYQILGALNSRGIWLTPANAEYRMIGKGRNRRRLTQEEADKYSLESGKEYRKMLIRYGARALRMPPEKAKDYISDLADKARDRALDRVARR